MSHTVGATGDSDPSDPKRLQDAATLAPPAMPDAGVKSRLKDIPLLLLLVFTFVIYFPIRNFPFSTIDDSPNVFANPFLCRPAAQNIGFFWTHVYNALYMPVTSTFWAFCARLSPLPLPVYLKLGGSTVVNAHVFHAASLVLHLLNVSLVYFLLRRLKFTNWASAAGATVFALHPMQVESVAWITGSNNLIAGFFSLITLILYLAAAMPRSASRGASIRTRGLLAFATIAFAAALLSKPTAVIVPLLVVAFEVAIVGRPLKSWGGLVALWAVMAAALVIGTQIADANAILQPSVPLWWRPFIVGDSLAFYLVKFVAPLELPVDYARRPDLVMSHWWGYASWALPAAVGYLLWRYRSGKLSRWVAVGALVTTVGLLPNSGLVVFYGQEHSTVADRYAYLPMLGVAIVVAAMFSKFTRSRVALGAFAVAMLLFSARAVQQIKLWGNVDLMANTIESQSPYSKLGHLTLGLIDVANNDLPGALRQFQIEDTLQVPATALAKLYIGTTLIEMNRQEEAVTPLNEAFRISPGDGEVWFQLWNILAYLNRYDEAEDVVRRHLVAIPADADAKFALAKLLLHRNDTTEAIPLLEQSEIALPNVGAVPYFLGTAFEKLNRSAEAVKYYRRAARLDPLNSEVQSALMRLTGHGLSSASTP